MAQSANNLVITAADYKVVLTLNNNATIVLQTLQSISMSGKRESEVIHAIGQQEPIAQKRNNASFSGKLEMQVGEFVSKVLTAGGLSEGTQIEGATLAITSLNVAGLQRVYSELNIDTESIDIKAKDKQSIVSLDWNAISVLSIGL